MYILVVEDDYLQAEWICRTLKKVFRANVDRISTESEFRKRIKEIEKRRPHLIIMDVMLPWTDPSPTIEPPPADVLSDGFYRAGIRCVKLLAANEVTRNIPVILYTVLERADLEEELKALSESPIVHLRKDSDDDRIIDLIRELTQPQRS